MMASKISKVIEWLLAAAGLGAPFEFYNRILYFSVNAFSSKTDCKVPFKDTILGYQPDCQGVVRQLQIAGTVFIIGYTALLILVPLWGWFKWFRQRR